MYQAALYRRKKALAYVNALFDGDTFRLLFPLPQSELDSNELLEQNPGY